MFIIPNDSEEFLKMTEYQSVKKITEQFIQTSNPTAFIGNCVATSDIIQTLLSRHGINSQIVECQAAIFKIEPEGRVNYMFVGYDNYSYPGQIDTHTVVITEGKSPILVDLSLGFVLPANKKYLIADAKKNNSSEEKIICKVQFDDYEIVYYEKTSIRLPGIHQKNLMQRIVTEQQISKTVEHLKIFVMCAVGLGLVNFSLNIVMIILRLFNITLVE